MDQQTFDQTRRSLHAIAELVLAGPQWATSQDIRLRATPGGFGTVAAPDLRIDGDSLVAEGLRLPLGGTCASLAAAAGIEARALRDVYADGPDLESDASLVVDPEAVRAIAKAFADGDEAMRALAPDEDPVLWPEHFDIGISVDEVNYGVSPGDAHVGEPYAYVGPWIRREGTFWNMSFGAARPLSELSNASAVEAFFRTGRELAAGS